MTAQTQPDVRDVLGPLINAFGEAQWQSGRGVPHRDLDQLFDAIINGAERLRTRPALSDEQIRDVVWGYVEDSNNIDDHIIGIVRATERAHGIGEPT